MDLKAALREERLAAYGRLRGGFPIPLAGAVYWLVLCALSFRYSGASWAILSFWASGLLFPLAVLFAKVFRNDFMQDRTAVSDVLLPTFAAMLLFWPMAIAALYVAPELVVLILAIGLSMHWPVIGWSYARTGIYLGHALVRTAAATALWFAFPDQRQFLVPLSVALIYLATTIVIYVDSGKYRSRQP